MKTKLNQQGFGMIEVLLIIVLIVVVGGIGWYVWQNKQKTDKLNSISSFTECKASMGSKMQESYPEVCVTKNGKSFPNPDQKVTLPAANTKKEETSKYLTIKEWGVKVTLSSDILDAVTATNSFDPGYYFLSTKSLAGTGCSTDVTAGGGFYLRYSPGDYDSETKNTYLSEYPDSVKIGQYYYAWGRNPAAAECDKDSAVQQKANKAAEEFKAAFKTIQPV